MDQKKSEIAGGRLSRFPEGKEHKPQITSTAAPWKTKTVISCFEPGGAAGIIRVIDKASTESWPLIESKQGSLVANPALLGVVDG